MHVNPRSKVLAEAIPLAVVFSNFGDLETAIKAAVRDQLRKEKLAAQLAEQRRLLAENLANARVAPTAEDLAQQHQPERVYDTFSMMAMQRQTGLAPDMSPEAVEARRELATRQLAEQRRMLAEAQAAAKNQPQLAA
jgi:aldehyde:ferredoxin oxidoreductase